MIHTPASMETQTMAAARVASSILQTEMAARGQSSRGVVMGGSASSLS
ncbi:MAG: hypothetical protein R3D03_08285 [Geminicoccaceae bacterium]